ncbi:hypothetical protein TIFTF001_001098 [Ficus carica]|uniref:Germin-like protein n=1 Tax=Ficus carica TaxID=3494 RepID=A0AA88CPI0_FICCA|nr:hypothetical protein TIFTF001_001098 [Ficus carica]
MGSSARTLNSSLPNDFFASGTPGLNTQGISAIRLNFAPFGKVPPHTHPRASEIIYVDQGTLYVGFVTSDEDGNRLFAKILRPGDVYVFPFGLIHFQFNPNPTPAVAFTALSSQNGGFSTVANVLFGPSPAINPRQGLPTSLEYCSATSTEVRLTIIEREKITIKIGCT